MDMAIVDSADPAANAVGGGACRRSAMRRRRPKGDSEPPPTAIPRPHHPSPPQRMRHVLMGLLFLPLPLHPYASYTSTTTRAKPNKLVPLSTWHTAVLCWLTRGMGVVMELSAAGNADSSQRRPLATGLPW